MKRMKKKQIRYHSVILLAILISSVLPIFISVDIITKNDKEFGAEHSIPKSSDPYSQYIDSITISAGFLGPGTLSNTYTDDGNYLQYNSEWFGNPINMYSIQLRLNFDPPLSGGDYYLSVHIASTYSGQKVYLYVNSEIYDSATNLDFDNRLINDVTQIRIAGSNDFNSFNFKIFYCKLVPTEPPPSTWYESNENYNIGDFPSDEWSIFGGSAGYIGVANASAYSVNMSGKAIRMYTPNSGNAKGMDRITNFTIDPGESLYLSFKAQMKPLCNGEGIFTIYAEEAGPPIFFEIKFVKDEYGEKIRIEFADGHLGIFNNIDMNQVYSFDIVITKDPTSNLLKHFIFIDQKLELLYEANTMLYPNVMEVVLAMTEDGPGELFLDNFYMGYVDQEKDQYWEDVTIAYPMYYLYVPQVRNDPNDEVLKMNMNYLYEFAEELEVSFSLSIGFTFFEVLSVGGSFPLGDVIKFMDTDDMYEVSTLGEDIIVFHQVEGSKKDINFTLPGDHPDNGASIMTGWYDFIFINEKINSKTTSNFEQTIGDLPQEYYDCKNQSQKIETKLYESPQGGNQTLTYKIGERELALSYEYEIGTSLGIPIGDYVAFDFGITYCVDYTAVYKARASLEISWEDKPDYEEDAFVEVYAPPEGTYSTALNLPPYFINHTDIPIPVKVTGLVATPGLGQIDLSWTANQDQFIHHYNIYRNNTKIAESITTSYTDTGLLDSTTYAYTVSAVNTYGKEGPKSDEVQATTATPEPGFTESILLTTLAIGVIIVLFRFNRKLKKLK